MSAREQALAALKAVLPLVSDMARDDATYGYYHGGDPRDFTPDEEVCTPEEIASHRAACEAWDRGETPDPGGPHQPLTEDDALRIELSHGVARNPIPALTGHKTVAHYGMGTTSSYDSEARALWEQVCAAITALESEP